MSSLLPSLHTAVAWCCEGVVVGLIVVSTAHAAEPIDRARDLYERGLQLFEEGYYEQAVDAWEESYALSDRLELQYNLAGAYERLGEREAALEALLLYRDGVEDDDAATLDLRIKNLRRRIDEARPEETSLPETAGRRWVHPVVASGLGVAAATGAGIGLASGLSARTAGDQALEHCISGADGPLCTASAAPLVDQQRGRALGADVAWTLAGVAAAGAVVVAVIPFGSTSLVSGPGHVGLRGTW